MRRVPAVLLSLALSALAACGVRVEAPLPPSVQLPLPAAMPAEQLHAYLHRVDGKDYMSLSQGVVADGVPGMKMVLRGGTAIRVLAADPAEARAMLRSFGLPGKQRKLWRGQEIVLDAASYERLQVVLGRGRALLADQLEMQLVRLQR